MIQKSPKNYRLEGANRLKLLSSYLDRSDRIEYIKNLLADFSNHQE